MTNDARERDGITGSVRAENGQGVVAIEARFEAAIHDLWSAVTEPDRVACWYGEVDGDLRPGGEFRLHVPVSGWYGTGQVLECEAPHRLVVRTRETDESYEAGEGAAPFNDAIAVTLGADAGRTVLTLEIRGLPLDKIQFYGAGWQLHVEALADHLAGREGGAGEGRFDELVPGYQALAAQLS